MEPLATSGRWGWSLCSCRVVPARLLRPCVASPPTALLREYPEAFQVAALPELRAGWLNTVPAMLPDSTVRGRDELRLRKAASGLPPCKESPLPVQRQHTRTMSHATMVIAWRGNCTIT